MRWMISRGSLAMVTAPGNRLLIAAITEAGVWAFSLVRRDVITHLLLGTILDCAGTA
jgi:hypothetical protein